MIRFSSLSFLWSLLFCVATLPLSAIVIYYDSNQDVPSGGQAVKINGVTYDVGGSSVIQNTQDQGSVTTDDVLVTNINITDGTTKDLDFYNLGNAVIRNNNFTTSTGGGGVGVYNSSAPKKLDIADGVAAYEAAVINSATNTNLMNYLFYDGTSNMPSSGQHDYDLLYHYGFEPTDYLVVAERDGNTYFDLTPLGADGNVIAGANTITFNDDPAASSNGKKGSYGWQTGYENDADSNNGQDMWFSVASVSVFFESTSVTPETVFGYRIDNNGDADVKFFGASDDTFTNNPPNPLVPVPEPSSYAFILGLVVAMTMVLRRKPRLTV